MRRWNRIIFLVLIIIIIFFYYITISITNDIWPELSVDPDKASQFFMITFSLLPFFVFR